MADFLVRVNGRATTHSAVCAAPVHDLSVEDVRHGSVCFHGWMDLRDAPDFLDAIRFGPGFVEVDSDFRSGLLNRPASVCLSLPSNATTGFIIATATATAASSFITAPATVLRQRLETQGAFDISVDESMGACRFRVSHFSKYGLFDDDDEEEEEDGGNHGGQAAGAAGKTGAKTGAAKGSSALKAAAPGANVSPLARGGRQLNPAPLSHKPAAPSGRYGLIFDEDEEEEEEEEEEEVEEGGGDGEDEGEEDVYRGEEDEEEEMDEGEQEEEEENDEEEEAERARKYDVGEGDDDEVEQRSETDEEESPGEDEYNEEDMGEGEAAEVGGKMKKGGRYYAQEDEGEYMDEGEAAAAAVAAKARAFRRVAFQPAHPLVLPLPKPTDPDAPAPAAAGVQSGVAPKSAVDAYVLLGRSFRVGWGPHGLLSCQRGQLSSSSSSTAPPPSLARAAVMQVKVSPTLPEGVEANFTHCLEPLLHEYTQAKQHIVALADGQEMATDEGEGSPDKNTVVPGFLLPGVVAAVDAAHAIAKSALAHDDRGADSLLKRKAHFAFTLVDALWGVMGRADAPTSELVNEVQHSLPLHEAHMRRRRAFRDWLVAFARDQPYRPPQPDPDNADKEDELADIFNCICLNDIAGACEIAIQHKDYHLAMLLAEVEGPMSTRTLLREQLLEWRESGADQFINRNRLRLYALLAGCMVWPEGPAKPASAARLSVYASRSWARAMLQHLQYACAAVEGVKEAVAGYQKAYSRFEDLAPAKQAAAATAVGAAAAAAVQSRCAPVPLPPYLREEQLMGRGLGGISMDVCFELILMYAEHAGTGICDVLVPEATSPFLLDHRLGWALHVVLTALGVPGLSPAQEAQLHTEFAAQLEISGLWPWAVFVLQHVQPDLLREKLVRELLWRQRWDQVSREQIEFLVFRLGVPQREIEVASLMCAKYRFDHEAAADHALRGGLLADAHDILVQQLAYTLLLDVRRLGELKERFLIPLQAQGFLAHRDGEAFLLYAQLLNGDEVDLADLSRRIAHLPANTPRARMCLSEMASVVASKMTAVDHESQSLPPALANATHHELVAAAESLNTLPLTWTYRMPSVCRVMNTLLESLDAATVAQ